MEDITLHINSKTTATCVPNIFIDEYMANANGEFVKIYLYLLRCMNSQENFSISKMADKFEHTEKDIKRALKYWEKMHVLHLEYDTADLLTGICLIDSSSSVTSETEIAPVAVLTTQTACELQQSVLVEKEIVPAFRPAYTKDQMLSFQQDTSVQDLLFITEKYLGRTLNPTDINAILYWHEDLQFSIDLIEYLVEYCVDKGHSNIRYMDKVALGWHSSQITSVEQAKKVAGIHSQTYYAIMKAFGISGRKLVDFETTFIEKWTNTYGFTLDIITEACKRTMQTIHQPSFEYTDTILSNWNKSNIHHLEDIAVLDSAYQKTKNKPTLSTSAPAKSIPNKNRFTNYASQRTYDYDLLEKQLLNRS